MIFITLIIKIGEKLKKLLKQLNAKRAMIIKRGQNENDNAITKNKLTKRNTKKSIFNSRIYS